MYVKPWNSNCGRRHVAKCIKEVTAKGILAMLATYRRITLPFQFGFDSLSVSNGKIPLQQKKKKKKSGQ